MAAKASSLATVGTAPADPAPELLESELDEQPESPTVSATAPMSANDLKVTFMM